MRFSNDLITKRKKEQCDSQSDRAHDQDTDMGSHAHFSDTMVLYRPTHLIGEKGESLRTMLESTQATAVMQGVRVHVYHPLSCTSSKISVDSLIGTFIATLWIGETSKI